MKLFFKAKDGGDSSTVTGYWLIESKRFFSIALLRFDGRSREAFHSHAFNCLSVILKGELRETNLLTKENSLGYAKVIRYFPFKPFITRRETFHKVDSIDTTWLLAIRGPWKDTWEEFLPDLKRFLTLTHGRKEIK